MISPPAPHRPFHAPVWAWINLFSLDAVAIGVLWHLVFTVEFCGRLPAVPESAVLGMSIWLVYTADRLFDSMRLDCRQPHTLRHRVHFDFRGRLVALWAAVVVLESYLIIRFASESQLRWGFAAVAAVLVYVAGVHVAGPPGRLLPKELQAGLVFAFGVSLSAWAEVGGAGVGKLGCAMLMAALLFSANCLVIAGWERELDRRQGFDSWITRFPNASRWLPASLLVHFVAALAAFAAGWLTPLMTSCLIASDVALILLCVGLKDVPRPDVMTAGSPLMVSPRGLLADAALIAPPMIWGLASLVNP